MSRRMIGRTGSAGGGGSRRRRWATVLSVLVVAAVGLTVMRTVFAVHNLDGIELDGNALTNGALSHDWDQIYSSPGTSGAVAASFAPDGTPNSTIFTGGGSKDPIDLNQWAWKDGAGGLPDKDNLVNSFAARYSFAPSTECDSNGEPTCEVLYFGSDRFDNSGDAHQAFWFFQNPVSTRYDTDDNGSLDALCPQKIGGGTGFCDPRDGTPARHQDGDLLVISNFSNGGTTSTIVIYQWDSTINGNLRLLQSQENANCATADPNDAFCGSVNLQNGVATGGWPFTDKSGNGTYLQGEFFEAGVNLSSLGLGGECFASVLAETRSSTSTTATLKDFVLGSFADCDSSLVTTPSDNSGVAIPSTGISIGLGSVSVRDAAQLNVGGLQTWSGNMQFYLCGPIATGTCESGGSKIGADIAVNQSTTMPVLSAAATLTSAGRYCWRGEFDSTTSGLPDAVDASAGECFVVNPVQPSIPTTASPDVTLGNPVSDSATLTGTASAPGTPIINGAAGAPAGGSITFRLFGPNDANCTGTAVYTNTVPVSGNGVYGSGNFTPTTAGTYRWTAAYTGDLPNTLAATGLCNAANENVVVNPVQPAIVTVATAAPPNGAALGTALNDTATLSGAASGAGGSITFLLHGPVATNTPTCTGTTVGTGNVIARSVVNVSGNGSYTASTGTITGTLTPTAPGYYFWVASYSGDSPNTLPVAGSCGDANETSFLVSTSISTAQTFTIQDSATITASGGGNLAGSVRFQLFTASNCTGSTLVDQVVPVAGASPQTVSTTPVSITVSRPTLSWLVVYTSTNAAQPSQTSACNTENSSVTIVNGPQ